MTGYVIACDWVGRGISYQLSLLDLPCSCVNIGITFRNVATNQTASSGGTHLTVSRDRARDRMSGDQQATSLLISDHTARRGNLMHWEECAGMTGGRM